MSASQAHDLLAMYDHVETDGAHTVVAVELHHRLCLTSGSRFGCDPLRMLEDLQLQAPPPGSSSEGPLQVEERAPAALVGHWRVWQ